MLRCVNAASPATFQSRTSTASPCPPGRPSRIGHLNADWPRCGGIPRRIFAVNESRDSPNPTGRCADTGWKFGSASRRAERVAQRIAPMRRSGEERPLDTALCTGTTVSETWQSGECSALLARSRPTSAEGSSPSVSARHHTLWGHGSAASKVVEQEPAVEYCKIPATTVRAQ